MTNRRQLLQIAALSAVGAPVVAACDTQILPVPRPAATPDAQQSDEIALIVAYDAALREAPDDVRALYQRIRDEHAEHLRALGWQDPVPTPSTPVQTPSGAQLLRAEKAALRRHTQGARTTTDSEQAQILALIAASEAQHVVELENR